MLSRHKPYVRSIDIANELSFSKPSVSVAMKNLRENGYIVMDKEGLITLTDAGMKIASRIYERHRTLTRFFMYLGVDEETAREDACKVEHDLSDATYQAMKRHAEANIRRNGEHAPQ